MKTSKGQADETIAEEVLAKLRELDERLEFLHEKSDAYIKTLTKLGVMKDLSKGQQLELSALVRDLYASGNSVKWLEPQNRERREWARNGSQRIHNLSKKLMRARRAISDVETFLKKSDCEIATSNASALQAAYTALDPEPLEAADRLLQSMRREGPRDGMRRLYTFFTRDCRIARDQAEIRTAKIGNYLWDWNVTVVEYREERSDQRLGCEAVRKAVARRNTS